MGKNILFVDDELSILKSIKRSFLKSGYNIFLANSAKEGIDIIRENHIDVVVSDVKMPEVDGLAFLRQVKSSYPSIDRIVLSGFVEMDLVLRAIIKGIAFDYITKPWDNDVLLEKLSYIILIREQIGYTDIIQKLNQMEVLPKVDSIYLELKKTLNEKPSIDDVSHIAKKDIAITTKIMQLVNSAFYTKNKIGSLDQAIEILGVRGIKNIIENSSLSDNISLNEIQVKDLEKFNKLIIYTNNIFKKIYELYKQQPLPKELELMGIIPFIGKIILLCQYFNRYEEILTLLSADPKMSFWEAQLKSKYTDFTYIELGAYFLSLWNFPLIYFNVIFNFMTPYTAHDEIKEIISILNLSKEYAEKSILGTDTVDHAFTKEEIIHRIEGLLNEYKK